MVLIVSYLGSIITLQSMGSRKKVVFCADNCAGQTKIIQSLVILLEGARKDFIKKFSSMNTNS